MTAGPAAGRVIEIDSELVLGREGVDITIDDDELSRRHVALRPAQNGIEVEDLGSLNGTFVDGRRISAPQTLGDGARLKAGLSEGRVEVSLDPQVTRASGVPVADPDATVKRALPVDKPAAAAPAAAAGSHRPDDVTVKRPAGAEGPPPGSVPPRESASEPAGGSGGPPLGLVIGGILLLLAAIGGGAMLVSSGGDDVKTHKLDVRHEVSTPTEEDKRLSELPPSKTKPITWNLVGDTTGKPFGNGNINARVSLQPAGPPPGAPKGQRPPPAPKGGKRKGLVTVQITIRFDDGTIRASERLNNERTKTGVIVGGTGRILGGTGAYEGATGTFKVTGERPVFEESFETVHWTGNVKY
jgi:hypothetical protein